MSLAPIDILHLFAYAGPNIFGPQPGVLLRVQCDSDRSEQIRQALKDGAQFIGMIIAYLNVTATPMGEALRIDANFTTPTPDIGKALAEYVVAGIHARASNDEEWDRDTPLFALQQRRRQEALPLPALQLSTEARKRGLPVLQLPDGRVQFGYGACSWAFDPATHREDTPLHPPWEQLGDIPLYVVCGETTRAAMVQRVAAQLQASGQPLRVLDDADYAATLELLADPSTTGAVLGLRSAGILQRGLAFDRCTQAIISDLAGSRPAEALDDDEWARALGVPMLVASSPALLNTSDPHLARLADYAPHGMLPLSALGD